MDPSLMKEFSSPGSQYRGKPFWAWNGKLEPDELRRQIRIMRDMGLGGFFMHARVGLATPYLSEEWFKAVDACVDEAGKLGMEAWLYDEDRWPSGAAGGLVTKDPKYRMRGIMGRELAKASEFKWDDATLAAFTARIDGAAATDVERIKKGTRPGKLAPGRTIIAFKVELAPLSDWFNGFSYLDTMNPEAVRKFIAVTHEAYRKRYGAKFGNVIPGIFTDEPHHGPKFGTFQSTSEGATMPWTDRLPAEFKRRYGYDILARLPELFYDVDGNAVTPARRDYHDCLAHLFTQAFGREIGKWCDENGILYTGHLLSEETLSSQSNVVSDCMRFYEYMRAPGLDMLTQYRREYDTAKQVTSVARQFGRKWRLTETYGCTGWESSFELYKALNDWQVALGINLRCPHLSWYTMEGQAKRDYPASIFYQSPWWKDYRHVEDYFARIHAVMTRGAEVRDLLVIHPVESTWLRINKEWRKDAAAMESLNKADEELMTLRDAFLAANIDFDYGSEDVMSRHASVRKGGAGGDGATLKVAKAAYKAVVVPPMVTMRRTTLDLLRRFAAAGGLVVFAGKPAGYLDARPSEEVARFAAECCAAPAGGARLAAAVEGRCRRVSISDATGHEVAPALYLLREDKEAHYLFICNTGEIFDGKLSEPPVARRGLTFDDVRVRGFGDAKGAPIELDATTGEAFAAEARFVKGHWEVSTSLPRLASRIFVFPKRASGKAPAPRPRLAAVRSQKLDPARWQVSLSEANCLLLDRAEHRVNGGKWRAEEEILKLDTALRQSIGAPRLSGAMKQPWTRVKAANPKTIRVELRYRFDAGAVPSGDLCLAIERPELYAITFNGRRVSTDVESGWWVDRSMRRVPLDPAAVRVGENELRIETDFSEEHPGLEMIYLLGNFSASEKEMRMSIGAPRTTLKLGDWTRQGLTFYAGSVSYLHTIRPKLGKGERLFVEVPRYEGVGVKVIVNGSQAGIIAWEPNTIEITGLVSSGEPATLALEVIGHRRNSHGPHHLAIFEDWVGPGSWRGDPNEWTDKYNLVPVGLMAPPRLVVKK